VIELMAQGLANVGIANRLVVCERTVEAPVRVTSSASWISRTATTALGESDARCSSRRSDVEGRQLHAFTGHENHRAKPQLGACRGGVDLAAIRLNRCGNSSAAREQGHPQAVAKSIRSPADRLSNEHATRQRARNPPKDAPPDPSR
jgi:hypothetical protein